MQQEQSEPTSIVLFAGEVTEENARVVLVSTCALWAQIMGYTPDMSLKLTRAGVFWAHFICAPVVRTPEGGACRTIPIPRPVDIEGSQYLLPTSQAAARAFRPGLYAGHMYLTLSNPKWTPCVAGELLFDPMKGACTAELGFCNLRFLGPHPPRAPAPALPAFLSRWVADFRATFQC